MKLRTVVLFAPIVTSFVAELKGKLHFYWREDVMKFEIKPSLKKIHPRFKWMGCSCLRTKDLRQEKAKNWHERSIAWEKNGEFPVLGNEKPHEAIDACDGDEMK